MELPDREDGDAPAPRLPPRPVPAPPGTGAGGTAVLFGASLLLGLVGAVVSVAPLKCKGASRSARLAVDRARAELRAAVAEEEARGER